MSKLELSYIGDDAWSRPVYQDQFQHLWKDIECGDFEAPSLYSSVNNEFDGEPNIPINQEFVIVKPKQKSKNEFQYMMLDRLRCDCNYYLGCGNRNPKVLYYKDEKEHLEAMKGLWNEFPSDEKPEWLTWEQILEYEKEMLR